MNSMFIHSHLKEVLMSASLGKHAVVIGAGISGLAAASALSGHFDAVTLLERDVLPVIATARPGTPQSNHPHGLLAGGLRAFCTLFPGFDQDLAEAGAVPVQGVIDIREELPGFDAHFPQRQFDWVIYSMSRPLFEHLVRRRVVALANVTIRDQCRVSTILAAEDGSVAGVKYDAADKADVTLAADLVIDASGRGAFALAFLDKTGRPQPAVTEIGIDMQYTTATFAIPPGEHDWKLVITVPDQPAGTKLGYLMPIEGNRWMALVGERHVEPSSADQKDFLNLARKLRTSTIIDAIEHAEPVDKIHRFGFPKSLWRHYENLAEMPRGLIPIGDAISRFNPIYGQGMTIAVKEACLLKDLLAERANAADSLAGLGEAFIAGAQPHIATAWALSVVPDFIDPQTRGDRPEDLKESLEFQGALLKLAFTDADVHELTLAVRNLITPITALQDESLVNRVQAIATQG